LKEDASAGGEQDLVSRKTLVSVAAGGPTDSIE